MNGFVFPDSGSRRLASLGDAVTTAVNTNENPAFTFTIPGGALGANGAVEIFFLATVNNNANAKTVRVKFGGNTIHTLALASKLSGGSRKNVFNQNDDAVQVVSASTLTVDTGTSGVAVTALTVDTSADVVVEITMQKATAGDTMTLEAASVDIFAP